MDVRPGTTGIRPEESMSASEDRADARALIGVAVIVLAIVVVVIVLNLNRPKPPPSRDTVNVMPPTSAPAPQ